MIIAVIFVLNMQAIVLLSLLCGLSSFADAQLPLHLYPYGEEITKRLDQILEERCNEEGVSLQDFKAETLSCIKQETETTLLYNWSHAAKICDSLYVGIKCTGYSFRKLKKCRDDRFEWGEIDVAFEALKASIDYMCGDDARRLKDLMQDADAVHCIYMMIQDRQNFDVLHCVRQETENVHETSPDVETRCKLLMKAANCLSPVFDDCASSKPRAYYYGFLEAGLRASPCAPYVDVYLDSAGSISVHFGLLVLISMLYIFYF